MVLSAETRNSVRSVLTPRHTKKPHRLLYSGSQVFGLHETYLSSLDWFLLHQPAEACSTSCVFVYFLRARLFTSLHKYTNVLTSQHSSKAINVNINNKVNWFALRFYSLDYVDLEWFCFLVNISNLFVFFRFQFYVIIFASLFHSNEELEWYEHRLKRFYCK